MTDNLVHPAIVHQRLAVKRLEDTCIDRGLPFVEIADYARRLFQSTHRTFADACDETWFCIIRGIEINQEWLRSYED